MIYCCPVEMSCSTSGRADFDLTFRRCAGIRPRSSFCSTILPGNAISYLMHQSFGCRSPIPAGIAAAQRMRVQRPPLTTPTASMQQSEASSSQIAIEDPWISRTLDSVAADPSDTIPQLTSLHASCQGALSTMRMPTTKNEEYRFTDITPLLQTSLHSAPAVDDQTIGAAIASRSFKTDLAADIVVVDGVVSMERSKLSSLPQGVFVGPVAEAPRDVLSLALGSQTRSRGGPFATLNGALCQDAVVIHVPPDVEIENPVRILYLSTPSAEKGTASIAAPRILLVAEERSRLTVVEEFGPSTSADDLGEGRGGVYATLPVAEIELDDAACLEHHYVVMDAPGAIHFKSTLVNQSTSSNYSLVEARLGGSLTRHDVGIEQLGADTETTMRSFILSGESELHDLHSKLRLNHPRGLAEQLHKCIASHPTSRGVFDGNVRVNRAAQRTDAQQLSRNLLLVPRATVNVKPNLQIIADDVKCTHGCTVSDLSEDELFYLRARGIDEATAREMLVYSFGREIVAGLKDELLLDRVEKSIRHTLASSFVA